MNRLIVVCLMALCLNKAVALNLWFDNANLSGISPSEVFVHFQGVPTNSVTYGVNTITFDSNSYLTEGISLQTLNDNGGFFNVGSLNGSIYISYRNALPGGPAAPSYIGATATITQY